MTPDLDNIKAALIAAAIGVLVYFLTGCGAQGSMMAPSYIGEGQGVASQLMSLYTQEQSLELQQAELKAAQRKQQETNP